MEEEGFTASPTAEPSGQKADHAAVLPGGGCSGQRWQAIDAKSPKSPLENWAARFEC